MWHEVNVSTVVCKSRSSVTKWWHVCQWRTVIALLLLHNPNLNFSTTACGFSPNPQKHLPNSFIHNSHAFLYCHNLFGVVVPLVRVTTAEITEHHRPVKATSILPTTLLGKSFTVFLKITPTMKVAHGNPWSMAQIDQIAIFYCLSKRLSSRDFENYRRGLQLGRCVVLSVIASLNITNLKHTR
jgi:hypothetical protein